VPEASQPQGREACSTRQNSLLIGALNWVAVIGIAVAWQLATRLGVSTSMSPWDLALLRYGIPGLVLLPVLLRLGFLPRLSPWWLFPAIVAGSGLPFGVLGMTGAMFAPAAHMGALLPGTMPLFVALLAYVLLGESVNRTQMVGFALICAGVLLVSGGGFGLTGDRSVLLGDALFLAASAFWALYTIAFRRAGLSAWHGAALACFWSAVAAVPIWAFSGSATLLTAPWPDIVTQALAQGVLAGILGLYTFGMAIRHLGAVAAATSGAAVPPLVAFGGFLLLGETLPILVLGGAVGVSAGILLALNLFAHNRGRNPKA